MGYFSISGAKKSWDASIQERQQRADSYKNSNLLEGLHQLQETEQNN